MAPKKKKITTQKVKKKKWYKVHASEKFSGALLGETYLSEPILLNGKYLTANLSTITRSMRKQSINVQFRVNRVEEADAYTEIVGYWLINAAIKRLVRRGRDKVSDSFLAKTKDKKVLRVKPLLITLNKGTKSIRTAVRLETRRVIREYAFSKTVEEFFNDVIDGKVQKLIKENVTKVFPLKTVELRMAKLEENINVTITEDGVKTEDVVIRKKDRGEKHAVEEETQSKDESSSAVQDNLEQPVEAAPEAEEATEDFGDEEGDEEAKEVETDEDDELQDEEEALIEAGEEKADETTEIADEPETVIEELDAEDAEKAEAEEKKEE